MSASELLIELSEMIESKQAPKEVAKSDPASEALSRLEKAAAELKDAEGLLTVELADELQAIGKALIELSVSEVSKKMDLEEFSAYALEQLKKAASDVDPAARLAHLAENVDNVKKFEFTDGELPSVSVFRDPAQYPTTDSTVSGMPSQTVGNHYAQNPGDIMKSLEADVAELTKSDAEPQAKEEEEVTEEVAKEEAVEPSTKHDSEGWPLDMNDAKNGGLEWGSDSE